MFGLKLTLITSLLIASLVFIFSPQISNNFFHKPELITIIKILAFAIPAFVLSEVTLAIIEAYREAKYILYSKNQAEPICISVLGNSIFIEGICNINHDLIFFQLTVCKSDFTQYNININKNL